MSRRASGRRPRRNLQQCEDAADLSPNEDQVLGRGAFGEVYAVDFRNHGLTALKRTQAVYEEDLEADEPGVMVRDRSDMDAEYEALRENAHIPEVMGVIARCETKDYDVLVSEVLNPMMTIDPADDTRYQSALYTLAGTPDFNMAWRVTLRLLGGLQSIHENGYAHRDIKPANIGLRMDADGMWRPVYLDLGMACKDCVPGRGGSHPYMPPEAKMGSELYVKLCTAFNASPEIAALVPYMSNRRPEVTKQRFSDCFGLMAQAGDVWALGLTLLQFYTGDRTLETTVGHMFPPKDYTGPDKDRIGALSWPDGGSKAFVARAMADLTIRDERWKHLSGIIASMLQPTSTSALPFGQKVDYRWGGKWYSMTVGPQRWNTRDLLERMTNEPYAYITRPLVDHAGIRMARENSEQFDERPLPDAS